MTTTEERPRHIAVRDEPEDNEHKQSPFEQDGEANAIALLSRHDSLSVPKRW
jgi:hypothetical protein